MFREYNTFSNNNDKQDDVIKGFKFGTGLVLAFHFVTGVIVIFIALIAFVVYIIAIAAKAGWDVLT